MRGSLVLGGAARVLRHQTRAPDLSVAASSIPSYLWIYSLPELDKNHKYMKVGPIVSRARVLLHETCETCHPVGSDRAESLEILSYKSSI